MNTQEREQLNQFLNKLVEVKLTEKDSEAENLIKEAISFLSLLSLEEK